MTGTAVAEAPASDGKITCHIDGARVHSVQLHIKEHYSNEWTVERYKEQYPGAELLSELAIQTMQKRKEEKRLAAEKANKPVAAAEGDAPAPSTIVAKHAAFHELFGLGKAAAAMNALGNPINVTVLSGHDDAAIDFLPDIDPDYVFNIDLLKKVMMGFELGLNVYFWGFHGTGKTTIFEQAAAHTKRPFVRVQHTINMQESEVIGQWAVRDGSTYFQLGPLPLAMINGWVYCADEYDFAMPSVISVYQSVLEHKPLLIKEAPPHFRKITPHPNFRFVATGNTNGVGDETGLYQGTLVQNAANYSRFEITEEVEYMEAKIEEAILISKTKIDRPNAQKIVKFANSIRDSFRDGKISMTVSPRELISASTIGIAYGGNWKLGLQLAFANRLSRVDKKVVMGHADRLFL